MGRLLLVLFVFASFVGMSLDILYARGGTRVLVDDDCICSEKDKSHRVFSSFDDGADCTNPNNSQPTVWVKMKGQTSTITLWTQVTDIDTNNSIDICADYQYCGFGDWLYFNDPNAFLLLPNGNGNYLVEVVEFDSCPFDNVLNKVGKKRYVVNIP